MNVKDELPVLKKLNFLKTTKAAFYASGHEITRRRDLMRLELGKAETDLRRLKTELENASPYGQSDADYASERRDLAARIAKQEKFVAQYQSDLQSLEARSDDAYRIAGNASWPLTAVCRAAGIDENSFQIAVR